MLILRDLSKRTPEDTEQEEILMVTKQELPAPYHFLGNVTFPSQLQSPVNVKFENAN